MNQDKDDILALRVESTPKAERVEVRRVRPSTGQDQAEHNARYMQLMRELAGQRQAPLTGGLSMQHQAAIAAQQAASPFGFGRTIFGGIG